MAFEALEPRNLLSTYYVDPAGLGGPPQDTNTGTIGSPLASLNAAVKRAQAGDTIILRAATYNIADINRSTITHGGAPGAPLTIEAAPGEHPILDLAEWYHWQQAPNGYWYVDLPANSVAVHGNNVTVEIRNGWAASTIEGDSVDGGPPTAFTQPDSVYYQNGQLAFDLTWYDQANHRLWFRSNQVQPITNPDAQCGIISSQSQLGRPTGASWLVFDGLQIENGYFGIHIIQGDHDVVENCRVTNMSLQGILVSASYSEISNNYVDAVAGQVTDDGFGGLNHDLYVTGEGFTIHDNFFGRSMGGASAQLMCGDATATTVFANNVCYGGQAAALIVSGSNIVVTGNVLISPPLLWRGNPPVGLDKYRIGLQVYCPQANITISGNYIEGAYMGMLSGDNGGTMSGQIVPGFVMAGNTIAAGVVGGLFGQYPEPDVQMWALPADDGFQPVGRRAEV